MNGHKTKLLAICIFMFLNHIAQAYQNSPESRDFILSLKVIEPTIKQGNSPEFVFTVANVSDSVKKILDAEHRIDLQHAYYRLILTQKGGLPVKNLLVTISDPAPIRGSDYIEIPPGGEKSFKFTNFPLLIKLLPPGVYEAYIRFWPIPYQSTAYASPVVQFTITE